ncbi:MAG: DUF3187 family protein [Gammaproteobacteria bacterium]|nr:DUF3187 family protein [Gammaproteobacteria bacterium]
MGAGGVASRFALWICLGLCLLAPALTLANEEFFGLRNYSPFARVFGLPGFADGSVLDPGETSIALTTTVINHSDVDSEVDSSVEELIVLDGETYVTDLVLGFGVNERLTLRVELPWVAYTGGIFDGAIEQWHDLWGFPNGFRDGPNNELFISYTRNGTSEFVLDSSGSGVGDVRLQAAYRLLGGDAAGVVLRAGVKLPTGDARNLRGSEAADVFLDIAVRKEFALPLGELVMLVHGGAMLLGDGEVLEQLQRSTVGFAGAGTVWRLNERWRFNLQLYAQSSYFHSDLEALGSDSLALIAGGSYTWIEQNLRLSVGMVEDLIADTTPDVALQIRLTKEFQ